eukprot:TRINITY_DN18811_c0_g1_i1.p1 TRINITY_DN18811_c0_g1~~TRINITY_DN18811_c0_g1_i1.p1  ORF type:complete len:116 (+),score=15.50 TRINITY_DN18811_c0_g1_i1:35-382(+)
MSILSWCGFVFFTLTIGIASRRCRKREKKVWAIKWVNDSNPETITFRVLGIRSLAPMIVYEVSDSTGTAIARGGASLNEDVTISTSDYSFGTFSAVALVDGNIVAHSSITKKVAA